MSNLNFNAVLRQTEISRSNRDFLCTEEHGFFCVRRREVTLVDLPSVLARENIVLVEFVIGRVYQFKRCRGRIFTDGLRLSVTSILLNFDDTNKILINFQLDRMAFPVIGELVGTPCVKLIGNVDFLLRDSHGDRAGNSGVEVRVGGREDYIKFIHASIAARGFCIVLIRPCERALNRLAVKGCSAGRNERGEQIAVGGVDRIRRDRRGILIRSRSCYNSLVCTGKSALLDCDRLRLTAIDRDGQRLGVKHMVLVRFQPDHDAVKRARLKLLLGIKRIAIGIRALIAGIAHRKAGSRRLDVQIKDSLTLGKTRDRCNGRGDLLLGDCEGCILNSHALVDSAVVSIRLGSDSIGTSICCSNIQFIAVVDNEASSVVAFCILHLEGDEAGDVLVGGRRCAQSEHFVAAVCDFRLIDGGAANSRCLTAYRHGILFYSNRVLNVICLARDCTLFCKFVNLQSKRSVSGLNIIFNLKQIICNINRCASRHAHASAGSTADF